MINQKFKIVFQIFPPANIPQKCFSAQNGPLDIRFQMRLNPNGVGFSIFGKIEKNPCYLNCFKKIAPQFLPNFSRNKKPNWLGSVSFEN